MTDVIVRLPPRLFRQRDTRWGGDTLGYNAPGSQYTIANYGCLITSLGALCDATPRQMNANGRQRGLFAAGSGLALSLDPQQWQPGAPYRLVSASARHPDDPFPELDLLALRLHLRTIGPAILELQWPRTRGQHFLLAIAAPICDDRETIVIADSERAGEIEELRQFYGAPGTAIVRTILYSLVESPRVPVSARTARARASLSVSVVPEQQAVSNGGGMR